MRVHRDRRLAEGDVEHDVRRLAPHAGQRLERRPLARHLPAMRLDQDARQRHHVPRLGIEQADGADMAAQPFLAELEHLRGRRHDAEQAGRRAVDARIGRLRGEHDGDEQLVGVGMDELGARLGIGRREAAIELGDVGGLHARVIAERGRGRKDLTQAPARARYWPCTRRRRSPGSPCSSSS